MADCPVRPRHQCLQSTGPRARGYLMAQMAPANYPQQGAVDPQQDGCGVTAAPTGWSTGRLLLAPKSREMTRSSGVQQDDPSLLLVLQTPVGGSTNSTLRADSQSPARAATTE